MLSLRDLSGQFQTRRNLRHEVLLRHFSVRDDGLVRFSDCHRCFHELLSLVIGHRLCRRERLRRHRNVARLQDFCRRRVIEQDCRYSWRRGRRVCDHKDDTTLHTADGLALDPTAVRYVVVGRESGIPVGTPAVVMDLETGRSYAAVVGDVGPRIGEVSLKLARDLEPASGPRNGIDRPLVYTFFMGARVSASDQEDLLTALAEDGPALIDAAWRDSPFDGIIHLASAR